MNTPYRRRRDQERGITTEPAHDEIARRAYELYEQRAHMDGHDQEDWFHAERELQERLSTPQSVATLLRTGAVVGA